MSIPYDLAIVGGGMAGATLAAALAHTPLRVALIDATPQPAPPDHRLIALSFASCEILSALSLWPALAPHAAPIHTIHVSQKGRFGITRLKAADIGRDTLGQVVPARYINAALSGQLNTAAHLTHLPGTAVTALAQDEQQVTLTLDKDGRTETLSAAIVIAADGTHSTIRHLLNIPVQTSPSPQKALVTVTHLQNPQEGTAYERFHRTGALAMLPLTGNRTATVWTDTAETIDGLMTQSNITFLDTLQKQMGYRLGKMLGCDERFTYPLHWLQVKPEQQRQRRVLLTGNAAHTMHPIAAQGLNLALTEMHELAGHFSAQSPGSLTLPDRLNYLERQQRSFMLSKRLTQVFTGPPAAATGLLRDLGLLMLDASPSLRRMILRKAVGQP